MSSNNPGKMDLPYTAGPTRDNLKQNNYYEITMQRLCSPGVVQRDSIGSLKNKNLLAYESL
jgi:hypothetical protein